jgi:hypothetical protein
MTTSPYLEAVYAVDRVRYANMVAGFRSFAWQKHVLNSPAKRKVLDCARQAGKSSIVSVIPTHTAKYVPGSASFVLAATEQQAVYVVNKIRACMARDPTYPKLTRDSDSLIKLDNGSSIEVMCATEKSARGPSKPRCIIADEASRIEDEVITSGIIPMLNDNPDCELLVPSTPNGRTGFFFRTFNNPRWERYYVRSPFVPATGTMLVPIGPEAEFIEDWKSRGVHAWFSPRHASMDEQLEQLVMMGTRLYRQEDCGEFVEPESQVFAYDDIKRAFDRGGEAKKMDQGLRVEDTGDMIDLD